MSSANTIALIINGLTIAIALAMVILLLWQDSRSYENLYFSGLMLMVVIWSIGALLAYSTADLGGSNNLTEWGIRLLEFGFTGTCVGLYIFSVVLSGGPERLFVHIVGVGLLLFMLYEGWAAFTTVSPAYEIRRDGTLIYSYSGPGAFTYATLALSSMIIVAQRRRKIKDRGLVLSLLTFSIGIIIELVSPTLRSQSISLDICAISALAMSISLVRVQVIGPLRGRANQLKAVRDVGVTITSNVRLEAVLSTVAAQAARILQASGAAIFLNQRGVLELAAVHNMPPAFRGYKLALGEGLAGQVAQTRQSARIENYHQDWTGKPDMPFARESFGAVVAAPLIFADEVMGVLVVIEGLQGKRFDREDMRLLDLLGPQAAVAITNSRLFERQQTLASELAAANDKLETVLISTQNPVIALNRRFEITFANPAAVQLFEYGPLTGRSILEIAPSNAIPSRKRQFLRLLRRRKVFNYELTIRDRTYLCHLGLLGRTKAEGYVAVLNDVTQLKEIDRMKNQMIHMTSHDLKNPLAAAMFHTELLQEEGETVLTPEMSRDIETIWEQLQRMNRIIRGILDLERVQSGTSTFEDCQIDQIIKTSVQELEPQMARSGINLQTHISPALPPIPGNRQLLSQAMTNVIENAVKFTRTGGRIRVSAECVEDYVAVHVADTGIGIAFHDQPHIFEQFYRGHHPGAEQISGSGLGLSLVKAVVESHQGRVWLESEVNKGTVVHIMLPVHHAERAGEYT